MSEQVSPQDIQQDEDAHGVEYDPINRMSIPASLLPVKNIPELLVENRTTAVELAAQVMQLMALVATHFGIPLVELVFEVLPDAADRENIEADGLREAAVAKTYFDLSGAVSLADLCRGAHASKVPALRMAATEFQQRGSVREMCNATPPNQEDPTPDASMGDGAKHP